MSVWKPIDTAPTEDRAKVDLWVIETHGGEQRRVPDAEWYAGVQDWMTPGRLWLKSLNWTPTHWAEITKGPEHPSEVQEALGWALDYIDAIPEELASQFPAMPGFDRDYVEGLLPPKGKTKPAVPFSAPATASLGARLSKVIDAEEAARRAAETAEEERKRREKEEKDEEAKAKLSRFFLKVKTELLDALEQGRTPKAFKMPNGEPFYYYGRGISTPSPLVVQMPQHPYHDWFMEEFGDWALMNDLGFKFAYEHDGVGRESWYMVSLEPKK